MDDILKEKIDKALKNGKIAIDDVQEIVKTITKEVMEKSKTQGDDLKQTSSDLFKEIIDRMGKFGKSSYEFIKAASQGFMDGVKESNTDEKNLLKDTSLAIKESLKSFADAGVYVTKETAKNISTVIEGLFKKENDQEKK